MKINIPLLGLLSLLGLLLFQSPAEATDMHPTDKRLQDSVAADSNITVVSYFCKRDTFIYCIGESSWKIKKKDTIRLSALSTQVMLTVTDSTPQGYNMEYTFLDFQADTSATSLEGKLQNQLVKAFGEKIIGTVIKFRIDEYGTILAYDNLNEIKKQSKNLFKMACKEMEKLPEIKAIKKHDFDVTKAISQHIDAEALVAGYVEELELLFSIHGNQYTLGSRKEHQNATEEEYESDTYYDIYADSETGEYGITIDLYEYIPKEDIKALTQEMVNTIGGKKWKKEANEALNKGFEQQVKEDLTRNSYIHIKHFADGWPKEIITQESMLLMGQGKVKQTHITWDYYSVRNY